MPFAPFAKSVCLGLILILASGEFVQAKSPWQWVSFRRKTADPSFTLTDNAGPWLVFATSFAGEGAEEEATALAAELRDRYRLKTYVHSQKFDFSDRVEGIGINPDRSPKMMRYDKSGVFDEFAVLIGDFQSIDDPGLQKTLKRIKYAAPDSLGKSGESTTRRFAGLREMHRRINGDQEKRRKGPMGSAFATPNPRLPREAFAPKGVDSFVIKLNEGVEHSLLNCPAKYSVRVATFRGNVVIDQQKVAEIEQGGESMESRLAEAALKAHKLTVALRKKGYEAYEFHDRHESYVTVGGFDWVGQQQGNQAAQEMNPAILSMIQEFSPEKQPLPGPSGRTVHGLQPKTLNQIPFDIQPWPVEVPRRSIAKDYARAE